MTYFEDLAFDWKLNVISTQLYDRLNEVSALNLRSYHGRQVVYFNFLSKYTCSLVILPHKLILNFHYLLNSLVLADNVWLISLQSKQHGFSGQSRRFFKTQTLLDCFDWSFMSGFHSLFLSNRISFQHSNKLVVFLLKCVHLFFSEIACSRLIIWVFIDLVAKWFSQFMSLFLNLFFFLFIVFETFASKSNISSSPFNLTFLKFFQVQLL